MKSINDRIEEMVLYVKDRYNKCHFWKRGNIYADGFRNGANWMANKVKKEDI